MEIIQQKTPECNHSWMGMEYGDNWDFYCPNCKKTRLTQQESCQDIFDIMNQRDWIDNFEHFCKTSYRKVKQWLRM